MSLTRKTATYAGSAMIMAIVVILAANIYVGTGSSPTSSTSQGSNSTTTQTPASSSSQASLQTSSPQSSSTAAPSSNSLVLLQLTDPPKVPLGTTSLNLSYSTISLLVSEPAKNGQVTTTAVSVKPAGGSATVDLLKLQNVSQTIASAALPTGSTIYSATFTVSGISIEINGSSNAVTLATGGSSFVVTLVSGTVLNGTNAVLFDLTPTVVDTPAGYQMIPTSVGIMKPQSEVCQGSENPGWTCPVTDNDQKNLTKVQGQLTASLVALTVSGNKTTFTVQVVNSGNTSVRLDQIGIQGNLTVQSNGCATTTTRSTASTTTTTNTTSKSKGGDSNGRGQRDDSGDRGHGDNFGNPGCWNPGQWGQNQLLFTPVNLASTSSSTSSSTTATSSSAPTSSTGCTTGQMALSNRLGSYDDQSPLALSPGKCIILTFTGTIVFGHTQLILVPSTAAGQVYYLNVVASNDAQASLSCTLPLSSTSCTSIVAKDGW
ncbi:MAG: DUF4382 domain-containing protein [Thaumarchaeota archaeon]|nr:DUF4382 domain-containing protein [Nitrososphaerota archaeon]